MHRIVQKISCIYRFVVYALAKLKEYRMIRPDEEIVREVLAPRHDQLLDFAHGAWNEWRDLAIGGRLLFPGRSRACLVFDFMVQRAIAAWENDNAVRVIRRDETAKFVIDDKVVLRFKKADGRGLGSGIPTQATMKFEFQQYEMPGIPNVHKVEVLYDLNPFQTQIDKLMIVARDGDERLWDYVVLPTRMAEIMPHPITASADETRAVRVRLRKVDEEKKKDGSE